MPINSLASYWRLQAVDNSVGTHPTGYVAGQLQSATAAQWQNMYNAEVTLYTNEVAAYNDIVSQRDTWIGRANNAWGTSRVWNSGESWEAAYARVYTDRYNLGYADATTAFQPPASPLTFGGAFSALTATGTPQSMVFASGSGTLAFTGVGGTVLTVPKTGRYHIYAQGNSTTGIWGNNFSARINLVTTRATTYGAKTELHDNWDDNGNGNGHDGGNNCVCNAAWTGTLYVGDQISVQVQTFASSPPSVSFPADINTYTIEFIPTQAYPK